MIDLYLFNTIINTIWYIFTVLFVLYRFTSFFNYIYNFIKFCSKLFSGVSYLINKVNAYINYPNNYTYSSLESQTNTQPTFLQRCKTYIKSFFYKPTSTSNTNSNSNLYYIEQEKALLKQKEREIFDKQMNELYDSEIDQFHTSNVSQSTHFDFNSNIHLNSLDKSKFDNQYFNNKNDIEYNTNSKLFYSVNLNNQSNFIELEQDQLLQDQPQQDQLLKDQPQQDYLLQDQLQKAQSLQDKSLQDKHVNFGNPEQLNIIDSLIYNKKNEITLSNKETQVEYDISYEVEDNLNNNNNTILFQSFINDTIRNTNLNTKYENLNSSVISNKDKESLTNKKLNKKFNYEETILKNPYI